MKIIGYQIDDKKYFGVITKLGHFLTSVANQRFFYVDLRLSISYFRKGTSLVMPPIFFVTKLAPMTKVSETLVILTFVGQLFL